MHLSSIRLLPVVLVLIIVILACSIPGQSITTRPTPTDSIATMVAATFSFQMTESSSKATQTGQVISTSTNTPIPIITNTPAPSSTPIASFTPLPSYTPSPTYTASPSPTNTLPPGVTPATPIPGSGGSGGGSGGSGGSGSTCNAAQFLRDVTVPDGTEFAQGAYFTKTWRLKNVGSCTWSTSYRLVFVGGDSMGAPSGGVNLPYTTKPGEYVDASVDLVAPSQPGDYRGNWKLSDNTGHQFGIGSNHTSPFYVSIEVNTAASGIILDFARSYCSADWQSNTASSLACPGDEGDENGFVIYLSHPNLENKHEDEPTIWTQPDFNSDGFISGVYPAYTVQAGDRFKADVGCLYDNPGCNITFKLDYYNEAGALKQFLEWNQVYDGVLTYIDIDLGSLVDKTVRFVLTVQANEKSRDNAGFWLYPQIYRPE